MSGGGKCSSILLTITPEVFAGAVPIVGLTSWHTVQLPDRKYLPRGFAKPTGPRLALLKTRRIAGITGDKDFNQFEMLERTRMLALDGLQARIDDLPGLDHEMPTPAQFAEAQRWADEPQREAAQRALAKAEDLLAAHIHRHGEGPPATREARASLVAITQAAPWSDPAWTAAGWLGFSRPAR
jgi:hypothetical protein